MIGRQIAALALVLAVLGAFYCFYEIRWKQQEADVLANSRRLFDLEREKIEDLCIRNSKTTLVLKKESSDWVLTDPFREKGKKELVESILDMLGSEPRIDELRLEEGMLSDFGLAPPAIEISLQGESMSKQKTIQVGSKSPTGKFLYLRIDSEPRILLVRSCLKNLLNRSIRELTKGLDHK